MNDSENENSPQPDDPLAFLREMILKRGEKQGFPSIVVARHPDGSCDAWAEGKSAWSNRTKLAEEGELRGAYQALRHSS